jgi:hypothetical protein
MFRNTGFSPVQQIWVSSPVLSENSYAQSGRALPLIYYLDTNSKTFRIKKNLCVVVNGYHLRNFLLNKCHSWHLLTHTMAVWQLWLWSFKSEDAKLVTWFLKNQVQINKGYRCMCSEKTPVSDFKTFPSKTCFEKKYLARFFFP